MSLKLQRVSRIVVAFAFISMIYDNPVSADQHSYSPEDAREWIALSTSDLQFSPGDTLGLNDLDKLTPVLAAPYIELLKFPELEIEIAPTGDYSPHEAYFAATEEHSSQTKIGEHGNLLNYVAGQPFTSERVDAEGPDQAGAMHAWNYEFRYQRFGQNGVGMYMTYVEEGGGEEQSHQPLPDKMLSGGGKLVRFIKLEFERTYFNHLALLPDSDYSFGLRSFKNALWKDTSEYNEPEQVRGDKFLIERSLDWKEEDTLNAYISGSRKVRRLSAKEKTDSFLGTEMTLEDFYGFDGQIHDYSWRYLGRKTILAVMNSKHPYPRHYGPQSRIPHDRWELRECIVLQYTSKHLDYHPYKTQFLFVDAQNYQAVFKLIFDRDDKFFRAWFPIYQWTETTENRPEKNKGARVSMYKGDMIQNFQTGKYNVFALVDSWYPHKISRKVKRRYSIDNLTAGR